MVSARPKLGWGPASAASRNSSLAGWGPPTTFLVSKEGGALHLALFGERPVQQGAVWPLPAALLPRLPPQEPATLSFPEIRLQLLLSSPSPAPASPHAYPEPPASQPPSPWSL